MLIHSGKDMEFFFNDGGSDYLLVTFGELAFLADGKRYWGKPMIERHNIAAIGIAARTPNWFPHQDIDEFLARHRSILDRFKGRIVLAGHSMGGYGAIKHSRRFGASTVVATVPQYTLDRSSLPNNTRPAIPYFRPELHTGMEPKPEELSGEIYIVADLGHSGRPQFDAYARMALPQIHIFNVPSTGHETVVVFARQDRFLDLVTLCRARDDSGIRRLIRTCRKGSDLRVTTIAMKAAGRRPDLAIKIYRQHENRFPPAYMSLLAQGLQDTRPAEATAILNEAIRRKPELKNFPAVSELLAARGRGAEAVAMVSIVPPI
jgi:hypothetical protein